MVKMDPVPSSASRRSTWDSRSPGSHGRRQDRNVESEGKCDGCPIVGVSGHPSARRTLHVLIERPGYDLDHVVFDEVVDDPEQLFSLLARQAPLADDGSDTLLQLMLRLLPLLLGNYTLEDFSRRSRHS